MPMRMNIENAATHMPKFTAETLVENLKELRDRTAKGDMAALQEFFDTFVFDDSKDVPYKMPDIVTAKAPLDEGEISDIVAQHNPGFHGSMIRYAIQRTEAAHNIKKKE